MSERPPSPDPAALAREQIETLQQCIDIGRMLMQRYAARGDAASRAAHARVAASVSRAMALARRIEISTVLPPLTRERCRHEPEVVRLMTRNVAGRRRAQDGRAT